MKYRAYRTKSDNAYRFQFMTDGGDTILNGGPFQEKEACFDAIRAVIAAAGDSTNYSQETKDGQSYFIISSAGNEIARSQSYASAGDASNAMALTQKEGPSASAKEKSGDSKAKAAPTPKDGSSGKDDYHPLAFYESNIKGGDADGFNSFEAEGEYYFTYNMDGMVVWISEGYSSDNSRDNGINSVKKNMPLPERYQQKEHSNGKHFLNLRAGNNQEIATSRWFDSAADAATAASLLQGGGKGNGAFKAMFSAGSDKAIYKDYKPLNFYQKRIEGTDFGFDSFAELDKHYFAVNYEGKPVLISETYQSTKGRDNGISSIKRNAKKKERYVKEQHPNGKYYFRLLAGNKQEIATSRWFDTSKERDRMINWLTSTGGTRRRKKAVREKSTAERVYHQQGLSYPCSDITYDTFKSGGNNKYYFVFKDKEGKAILINGDVRGYVDTAGVEAAIEKVKKFGPDKDNYERRVSKTGKHYFFIKDGDGKSVARGSLFYADKDVMEANIKSLACGAPAAPAAKATASSVVDDYLPCEAYAGDDGFHTFFNEARNEHYFAYNANGKTYLRSEGYTAAAGRDNGIESVKKNSPIDARWGTDTALNGKYHFFKLKAGNNQEIGRSCYYDSAAAMQADYDWVRGGDSTIGKGAAMFAGAWMTGNAIAARKKEEEDRLAADAAAKAKAEAEAAAKAKAEAEAAAKAKAEAEAKARAEEEARLAAEAKAKARAEEEARLAAKAKAKAEEEARLADIAKAKAAEEARLAAEAKKKSETVVDDYLPCERYNGDAGFYKFTDEASGEHYFAYNNSSRETFLRSEGYKTVAARDNGIESVKKNAPIEKRWGEATALNDKYHYYTLKAGNNQEIARSCYYKDRASMLAALGWVKGGKAGLVAPEVKKVAAVQDDYLPCERYKGDAGFYKFTDEASGEHYFAYNNSSGETFLRSEGYKTVAARDNGIESVKKNSPIEKRWGESTALNGKYHYYYLKAGNNQEIARSCYYKDKAAMLAGMGWVKGGGSGIGASLATGAAAVGAAAIAATPKPTPPPPPPPPPKKVVEPVKKVVAPVKATAPAPPPPPDKTRGGLGWLLWLLGALALAALLWFLLKDCQGCAPTPPPPPPPVVTDAPVAAPMEVAPLCKNGDELGLTAGSMEHNLANFLSDAKHTFPRTFTCDKIKFSRGSTRLNTAARKQLDNVASVLKECGEGASSNFQIRGLISGEQGTYRGSKEISLDDVRAREVYNYLKSRGIAESRMDFVGGGEGDSRTVELVIRQ